MPYLRIVKTPLIRRTPLGMYMGFPHDLVMEAFTKVLEIDEATEMLLRLCDGTRTRDEILQALSEQSGESVSDVEEGLDDFIEYLVGEGVLEWRETESYVEPVYKGDRPFSLTIALTYACNLKCPFCAVDAGNPLENELTADDIAPLVEQIKKFKPTPLWLSGGEPLLRKELLLSILEEVCPITEIGVSVFTNGTLVTPDYAQHLYDAGLRYARISIDGHTAALHDTLRGEGSFEKTMKGVEYLREVGIHVNGLALLCRANLPYLNEIRTFLETEVDSYNVSPILPIGKALGSDLLLNSEERQKVNLSRFGEEEIEVNIIPRDVCIIGLPLYINPIGDCYPCFYMQVPEFKVGNIRESDLSSMYKTDVMHNLLQMDITSVKECNTCDLRYICGGGCRGEAYRVKGSLYVPDPYACDTNKELSRRILEKGEENTRNTLQELVGSTKALQ